MSQIFELIFFAMLACYLVFRLWSVLGQNTPTDEERQGKNNQIEGEAKEVENVIALPQRSVVSESPEESSFNLPYGVREGVRSVQQVDPQFELADFMEGARFAYGLIIENFAKGNREELKTLLTPDVYAAFSGVIDVREANGHRLETIIDRIDRIELESAEVHHKIARLTVRYRTHQIMCTHDQAGAIIDNPAKISKPVTDIWTFERDMTSTNPNWFLCATRTEIYH